VKTRPLPYLGPCRDVLHPYHVVATDKSALPAVFVGEFCD
jgi:hypothetical protein